MRKGLGISLLPPAGKKVTPEAEKTKNEDEKGSCSSDSTMCIIPRIPRRKKPRVTLPENASPRMKRSSFTVIDSGDKTNRGVSKVVLLPKGRLQGVMIAPKHLLGSTERVVVRKGDGIRDVTATKVTVDTELVEPSTPGLTIESLAKAVEAMVDKESQGLNIQAAEALAQAITRQQHEPEQGSGSDPLDKTPIRVYKATKVPETKLVSPVSSPSFQSAMSSSSSSLPTSSGHPAHAAQSPVKVRKLSNSTKSKKATSTVRPVKPKSKKKTSTVKPAEPLPLAVNSPHDDHIYALPTDAPQNVEEPEALNLPPMALAHLQALSKGKTRKGPFTCMICNKELTAASTLRDHYRSHAGIKPYQCEICQATFTRLHSLKYHTMIHKKEVRFLCSYCQRQFRHSSHYREHLRRHTGEEPFGCSDCPARFKTRNTYKRHLRSKHGKVVAEDGKINLAPTMFPDYWQGVNPGPDT